MAARRLLKMQNEGNKLFLTACSLVPTAQNVMTFAGATHRQWRKWVRGRGQASGKREEARLLLEKNKLNELTKKSPLHVSTSDLIEGAAMVTQRRTEEDE